MDEENAYRHVLSQGSRKSPFRPHSDVRVRAWDRNLSTLDYGHQSETFCKSYTPRFSHSLDGSGSLVDYTLKDGVLSLPRHFVDATFVALTKSTTGEYLRLEDHVQNDENSDEEDWLEENSIDVQQGGSQQNTKMPMRKVLSYTFGRNRRSQTYVAVPIIQDLFVKIS